MSCCTVPSLLYCPIADICHAYRVTTCCVVRRFNRGGQHGSPATICAGHVITANETPYCGSAVRVFERTVCGDVWLYVYSYTFCYLLSRLCVLLALHMLAAYSLSHPHSHRIEPLRLSTQRQIEELRRKADELQRLRTQATEQIQHIRELHEEFEKMHQRCVMC